MTIRSYLASKSDDQLTLVEWFKLVAETCQASIDLVPAIVTDEVLHKVIVDFNDDLKLVFRVYYRIGNINDKNCEKIMKEFYPQTIREAQTWLMQLYDAFWTRKAEYRSKREYLDELQELDRALRVCERSTEFFLEHIYEQNQKNIYPSITQVAKSLRYSRRAVDEMAHSLSFGLRGQLEDWGGKQSKLRLTQACADVFAFLKTPEE